MMKCQQRSIKTQMMISSMSRWDGLFEYSFTGYTPFLQKPSKWRALSLTKLSSMMRDVRWSVRKVYKMLRTMVHSLKESFLSTRDYVLETLLWQKLLSRFPVSAYFFFISMTANLLTPLHYFPVTKTILILFISRYYSIFCFKDNSLR